MDNIEWIRQRRLRSLRQVAPDKVLDLIDEFNLALREANKRLNDGILSPLQWIQTKRDLFHKYCNELRKLDTVFPMNAKTFGRVMNILCESDNLQKYGYKNLMVNISEMQQKEQIYRISQLSLNYS